jgi:hypothetical protein
MTIDGGAMDLTLQTETQEYYTDYGGVVAADLLFFTNIIKPVIRRESGHPRNEKYL